MAVAQNIEPVGVGQKLVVEIEHVAVSISFAEDGNETEDPALKSVGRRVGGNQAFGGQLRRRVKRSLDRKWRILGSGEDFRFAINRTGGGEGDFADPAGAHGLEHVGGRQGVLFQVSARPIGSEAYVGIGGQVEHEIAARHGAC